MTSYFGDTINPKFFLEVQLKITAYFRDTNNPFVFFFFLLSHCHWLKSLTFPCWHSMTTLTYTTHQEAHNQLREKKFYNLTTLPFFFFQLQNSASGLIQIYKWSSNLQHDLLIYASRSTALKGFCLLELREPTVHHYKL